MTATDLSVIAVADMIAELRRRFQPLDLDSLFSVDEVTRAANGYRLFEDVKKAAYDTGFAACRQLELNKRSKLEKTIIDLNQDIAHSKSENTDLEEIINNLKIDLRSALERDQWDLQDAMRAHRGGDIDECLYLIGSILAADVDLYAFHGLNDAARRYYGTAKCA